MGGCPVFGGRGEDVFGVWCLVCVCVCVGEGRGGGEKEEKGKREVGNHTKIFITQYKQTHTPLWILETPGCVVQAQHAQRIVLPQWLLAHQWSQPHWGAMKTPV